MPNVEGVGPEVEHITLDGGGQRSNSPYAFDQLPPRAMFKLARRFAFGMEKGYERDNWKKLPMSSFLTHALQHIFAFMIGDMQEGDPVVHLEAAMWNCVCAVEVYLLRKENPQVTTKVEVDATKFYAAIDKIRENINDKS